MSDHFPEEVRGWYVTNQMKGWHGVRWYRLREEGSGVAGGSAPGRGRIAHLQRHDVPAGGDAAGTRRGALRAGLLQPHRGTHPTYNFRDARRIQTHGRVWRITAKDRPLVWQPKIAGEPVDALLELLKNPNYRTRYHARRELQEGKANEVLPAVKSWAAGNTADAHDQIEALWIQQNFNAVDESLLRRLLKSDDSNVRTAAVRVLRFWQEMMPAEESLALLENAVTDSNQRVRLEGVVACGFHAQPREAIAVAAKGAGRGTGTRG